jgi:hypothetical protein
MVQRIRRQQQSSSSSYKSSNSSNDDGDGDDDSDDDDDDNDPGPLTWTFTAGDSAKVPACSDFTLSWEGKAQKPFMLTAHQRDSNATTEELNTAAGWHNFVVAKEISDTYYTWTGQ